MFCYSSIFIIITFIIYLKPSRNIYFKYSSLSLDVPLSI